MIEAKEILISGRKLVWGKIKEYLVEPQFCDEFSVPGRYKREAERHWQMVRDYPERQGKYIRPTLLIKTAEAMGMPVEKTVNLAAAMQLSEDWILNHDDIEDDSCLRRGKAALHRIYGVEMAINAGDALQMIMWKALLDCRSILGDVVFEKVREEFYQMLMRTALGQTVELLWMKEKRKAANDDNWFFVADGKTAYYSIAGPMRLGAIAAGANEEELSGLAKFGVSLGRCFQLVDDFLDVTSDFDGLKQKGNDIYEGKMTVLLNHLWRNLNRTEVEKLTKIMAKNRNEKSEVEVSWVIKQMENKGSIVYARGLAEIYAKEAREQFRNNLKFLAKQPAREELESLVEFVLTRTH